MKLEGRVSIITGSASGIGRAGALEFAKEGALVVVADINFEGAQETAIQIKSAGGTALAVKADVSDPSRFRPWWTRHCELSDGSTCCLIMPLSRLIKRWRILLSRSGLRNQHQLGRSLSLLKV